MLHPDDYRWSLDQLHSLAICASRRRKTLELAKDCSSTGRKNRRQVSKQEHSELKYTIPVRGEAGGDFDVVKLVLKMKASHCVRNVYHRILKF